MAVIDAQRDDTTMNETVTAANVLTASENGKTFYLSALAGFLTTLPAVANGLKFKFVVKTAPTSVGYTFSPGPFIGGVSELEVDTGDDGPYSTTNTLLTLVANLAAVGDWVTMECDGTSWYVAGSTNKDGGAAFSTP